MRIFKEISIFGYEENTERPIFHYFLSFKLESNFLQVYFLCFDNDRYYAKLVIEAGDIGAGDSCQWPITKCCLS